MNTSSRHAEEHVVILLDCNDMMNTIVHLPQLSFMRFETSTFSSPGTVVATLQSRSLPRYRFQCPYSSPVVRRVPAAIIDLTAATRCQIIGERHGGYSTDWIQCVHCFSWVDGRLCKGRPILAVFGPA
jgi:hypothetical protein